ANLDGRKRQVDALARRADGEPQVQLLVLCPFRLGGEPAVEPCPRGVEQQRILARFLWKHAFRERGNEHHVEGTPSQAGWTRDKNAAVTAYGRLRLDGRQTFGENLRGFVEGDGSNGRHRPEIGKDSQDVFRPLQHTRGELAKKREPLAP